MEERPRWPREAWLPLIAGVFWFWSGSSGGIAALLLCLLPGALLVTTGTATLLWSGESRTTHFTAAGGVLGALLSLPLIALLGLAHVVVLFGLSAACFISAGMSSLRNEPPTEGVPAPEPSLKLGAMVALDEAVLADLRLAVASPSGANAIRVIDEVAAARELFGSRGWLEKPRDYYGRALPLEAPRLRHVRSRGIDFEHLSFDSEYEPRAEEPGRERWLGYSENRTAHAWVLRHAGTERPWLVCVHGYRMGMPLIDLSAFDPKFFHRKLGLNMLLPVLPLHGQRKRGWRSGDGYLDGDVLDTVHAEAQAMWDLQRMLSWIRGQGAPGVGVYGLSLGGYNAALLAGLDSDLRCAIAGVPATDLASVLWRHGPRPELEALEAHGLRRADVEELFGVISPLSLKPQLPQAARAIFGGVADRIVAPEQVRDLWDHWDHPAMVWYQGAHLSFNSDPRVRDCIETTISRTLL